MRIVRAALLLAIVLWLFGSAPRAQDLQSEVSPAHVAVVEGAASLTRDSERDEVIMGSLLVPGDRIRTDRGRVEILFPDGSALDLDEFTSLELISPTRFRVTEGRLLLSVPGAARPSEAVRFAIDTPSASAETYGPGEYRLSMLTSPSGLQTELAVIRGSAALINDRGTMPLRSAERSLAWDGSAPSFPQTFNSARFDAFDRWAGALREDRLSRLSSQYLPPDLRVYGGALDRHGSWQYDAPYGNVWYPNVDEDWRPYSDGSWAPVPSYGWTWIGVSSWAWPTHHYGRWGYERSRWFWIPDERWAPAWVSWGSAPGYVSWSPLGFDDRPLYGFSAASRSNGVGWTVVARDHFDGPRRNVRQYAISPRGLPPNTPLVTQSAAPLPPSRSARRRVTGAPLPNATSASPTPATGARRGSAAPRDREGPPATLPRVTEFGGAPIAERPVNGRDRSRAAAPPQAGPLSSPESSTPRAVPRGTWPDPAGPSTTVIYSTTPPPRRLDPADRIGPVAGPGPSPRATPSAPEMAPIPRAPDVPARPEIRDAWRPSRRSVPRPSDTAPDLPSTPPSTPRRAAQSTPYSAPPDPTPDPTPASEPPRPRDERGHQDSARAPSSTPPPDEGRRPSAGRAVPRNEGARDGGDTGQGHRESGPSGGDDRPSRGSRRPR